MAPKIFPKKKAVGWVNEPGLQLRNKSEVHAKIIDEKTGRRKTDVPEGTKIRLNKILNKQPETWGFSFGEKVRYNLRDRLFGDILSLRLRKIFKKTTLEIMVIGAGKGAEIKIINNLLRGSKRHITSLQLSDSLSERAKKIVGNKNYFPNPDTISNRDVFEHMNHLKFVNKYDYILSEMGIGLHTNHPALVLLKVASMLRVGGIARIGEASTRQLSEYLNSMNLSKNLSFKYDSQYVIIKRLK